MTAKKAAPKTKKEIIKSIIRLIKANDGLLPAQKSNTDKLTKKQAAIVKHVNERSWDGREDSIYNLVAALSGVSPKLFKTESLSDSGMPKIKIGMFVVPTRNDNGHNYLIGEVVFATESNNSQHMRGRSIEKSLGGNNLDVKRSGLRRPTEEELEKFLNDAHNDVFGIIEKTLFPKK